MTSLAELIKMAQSGSKKALSDFCNETYNKTYYLALKILNNHHDALDITQDTYVIACKRLYTLNDPNAATCWLSKITINLCRKFLKKKSLVTFDCEYEDYDQLSNLADIREETLPELFFEKEEMRKIVLSLLDQLPLHYKEILLLSHYRHLSTNEMMDVLEVSESTVRSRLFHARQKLKLLVEKEEKKGTKIRIIFIPILLTRLLEEDASKYKLPPRMAARILKNSQRNFGISISKTGLFARCLKNSRYNEKNKLHRQNALFTPYIVTGLKFFTGIIILSFFLFLKGEPLATAIPVPIDPISKPAGQTESQSSSTPASKPTDPTEPQISTTPDSKPADPTEPQISTTPASKPTEPTEFQTSTAPGSKPTDPTEFQTSTAPGSKSAKPTESQTSTTPGSKPEEPTESQTSTIPDSKPAEPTEPQISTTSDSKPTDSTEPQTSTTSDSKPTDSTEPQTSTIPASKPAEPAEPQISTTSDSKPTDSTEPQTSTAPGSKPTDSTEPQTSTTSISNPTEPTTGAVSIEHTETSYIQLSNEYTFKSELGDTGLTWSIDSASIPNADLVIDAETGKLMVGIPVTLITFTVKASDGDSYEIWNCELVLPVTETFFPDENFRSYVVDDLLPGGQDYFTKPDIEKINKIEVPSKNISNMTGIEYFTQLTYLDCSSNSLEELIVSNNTELIQLFCSFNQLKSLEVSANTKLDLFYCNNNLLTELDLSNNAALSNLECHENSITELDISKLTKIKDPLCIKFSKNGMTALYINAEQAGMTFQDFNAHQEGNGEPPGSWGAGNIKIVQ